MAKRLQHRGGTTSQHSSFTGAVREVTVDTDKNTLVVHDGATAGGHPLATATNFKSTGIDDNATSTAISIDSSQNVSFNDDTGNTEKLVWNATDESLILKYHPTYGDYYIAYKVPQVVAGGVTSDVVLLIGEKDVNQIRIQGRFYTPLPPNINDNRNAFIVDIIYQQWNGQLPRFSYDAIHTGSRANTVDNMELGEAVYNGTTYYAIKIQANYASLSGVPIYFTGGITNTTDLGWLPEGNLTSFTAVTPSSQDSSDKRISAKNIRFKNEKNEDKMLITSDGNISFYEDTGTTATMVWNATTERLGIGTGNPQNKLDISAITWNDGITIKNTGDFNVGIFGDANRTSAGGGLLNLAAKWNAKEVAGILFQAGLDTTNKDDGDILFRTSSANNISERMRITSAGNVGILNSAPTAPLEVNGLVRVNEASGVSNGAIIIDALATGNPNLAFQQAGVYKGYIHYIDASDTICLNDGSGNGLHYSPTLQRLGLGTSSPDSPLDILTSGNSGLEVNTGTSSAHRIYLGNTGGTSVVGTLSNHNFAVITNASERMRIDSSGNVGIGTSSPTHELTLSKSAASISDNPTFQIKNTWTGEGNNVGYSNRALTLLEAGNGTVITRIQTRYDTSANLGEIGTETSHPFRFLSANTERMRIDSVGRILINTTSHIGNSSYLNIANTYTNSGMAIKSNTANAHHAIEFHNTNNQVGFINTSGTSTVYSTSSDYRLKENVVEMTNATDRLKQLQPKRFNFIADEDTTVDGFLAHEVSNIVPEAISGEKDATKTKEKVVVNANGNVIAENIEQADWETGKIADENGNTQYPTDSTWEATKVVPVYQGIDQSKLVPLLVKTIQELEARITALETTTP